MRKILCQEDDLCMKQMLPRQNLFHCFKELKKSEQFSKEHFDAEYWDDAYCIPEGPVKLSSLNIQVQEFCDVCKNFFEKYDIVEIGMPSEKQERVNITAFGTVPGNFVIFAGFDNNQIIQDIWFQMCVGDKIEYNSIVKLFLSLGELRDMIYIDWTWGRLVNLHNKDSIDNYLQLKLKN